MSLLLSMIGLDIDLTSIAIYVVAGFLPVIAFLITKNLKMASFVALISLGVSMVWWAQDMRQELSEARTRAEQAETAIAMAKSEALAEKEIYERQIAETAKLAEAERTSREKVIIVHDKGADCTATPAIRAYLDSLHNHAAP